MKAIDEFVRLQAAATPGPWAYRPEKHHDWGIIRAGDGMPVVNATVFARIPDNLASDNYRDWPITEPPEIGANAKFIAHARNSDIGRIAQDLAARLERIREILSEEFSASDFVMVSVNAREILDLTDTAKPLGER